MDQNLNNKKILMVFGTRPEAIKMAPLYLELKKSRKIETRLCITSQHKEMLVQILKFFEIQPDYDLDVMEINQNLYGLTSSILTKLKNVMDDYSPDMVLVHGDTTTGMTAALASFYYKSKIGHIEAGLRTNNKYSPFPEEINRKLISSLADFHFCPTEKSKKNLLEEKVQTNNIIVTGNTVIDALKISINRIINNPSSNIIKLNKKIGDKKFILVTAHRRENHGQGIINICKALLKIVKQNSSVMVVFPVHLNPNVRKPVRSYLNSNENIFLTDPQNYEDFLWLMKKAYLIISDSGGVQEEAPTFGKPVLVLRDSTERPEAIEAGTVVLVGNSEKKIVEKTNQLLNSSKTYEKFSNLANPYGDGTASLKIRKFVEEIL